MSKLRGALTFLAVVSGLVAYSLKPNPKESDVVSTVTSPSGELGARSNGTLAVPSGAAQQPELRAVLVSTESRAAEFRTRLRSLLSETTQTAVLSGRYEAMLAALQDSSLTRQERQLLLWEVALEQTDQFKTGIVLDLLERIGSEHVVPLVIERFQTAAPDDRLRLVHLLARSLDSADLALPEVRVQVERNTVLIADLLNNYLRTVPSSDRGFPLALEFMPSVLPQEHARALLGYLLSERRIDQAQYFSSLVRIYASEPSTFNTLYSVVLPQLAGQPVTVRKASNQVLFEHITAHSDSAQTQNPALHDYIMSQRPSSEIFGSVDTTEWLLNYSAWLSAAHAVSATPPTRLNAPWLTPIDQAVAIASDPSLVSRLSAGESDALSRRLDRAISSAPQSSLTSEVLMAALSILNARGRGS